MRAAVLIAALCSPGAAFQMQSPDPELRGKPQNGNAVTHWSRIASEIFPIEPGPIIDSRAFAILHAALHDALNNIDRRYKPYTLDLPFLGASADAAVGRAAHHVLAELAPSHRERIDRELTAVLSNVPDGPSKIAGLTVGELAARANLDRRSRDGIAPGPWPPRTGPITEPVYVPAGTPGDYDFTPPFDAAPLGPVALFPGWGRLTPFAVDLERHRLEGPDPLDSRRYARDLNFVKSFGSLKSGTRTPDLTETALFWFEEDWSMWNKIARTVIEQRGLDPWRAAHVLALLNFALTDTGIAALEAKFHFRFWRPYTAIRRAGDDANDDTEPDPDWLPLLWPSSPNIPPTLFIPPFPDYPSLAAASGAAASEVLSEHIGEHVRFEAQSVTLPNVTRLFRSFRHAALEQGLSRVFGGIHFLHAVEDGFAQGMGVGREVNRLLPPVRR
jgi:membrane-associated phospholipid phosphatase